MRLLRSIRFNIFLGLLIALAAAVGTLLPQVPEVPEKVSQFHQAHPQWSKLFDFFGLFNIYQSWWFMGMLGLMAFDIIVCKLWNKPPDVGMVALPPEINREEEIERQLSRKEAALKLKPYQALLRSDLPFDDAFGKAEGALKEAGYRLSPEFRGASGGAFVATKHGLQRWGSYIAHIALVVILAGSLVKGLFGFVEMVPVLEGGSRAMQNKPDWEVYVDKFTVRYYEGTRTPKIFSSVMRVQQGDRELGAKTIYVNDPLDIGGVRFYQASWGAGGMFRSVTLKIGAQKLSLPQKKRVKIKGTPFTVEADMMLPNFTIKDGQADTASLDLQNPAVRLSFTAGPHKTSPLWLFENNPELCFVEDENGMLDHAPKPPFQIVAIDPVLFSGIQVAYDPGYRIVLTGAILWLTGIVSLFYLHRRRLWVLVEPDDGQARITLGGWSSRGPKEYEREFQGLVKRLGSSLACSDFQISRNPLLEVS
ncbi:MAG: cytochrome c biogenesis protein ResB [Elusimicrobia bacterium]|nr:cytochrome c biogenesis protein ResB [Elusimicrobiota bacterium]